MPSLVKQNQATNILLTLHQGSILLNILTNHWFTLFLSQIVAVLFPSEFLMVLRIKFVSFNTNFELRSHTRNILHENVSPPNNAAIIKLNTLDFF